MWSEVRDPIHPDTIRRHGLRRDIEVVRELAHDVRVIRVAVGNFKEHDLKKNFCTSLNFTIISVILGKIPLNFLGSSS